MKTIYLAWWHDRHTDDVYRAFEDLDVAKAQCYEWISNYKDSYTFRDETSYYGDWCLICNDDYYAAVKAIELVEAE